MGRHPEQAFLRLAEDVGVLFGIYLITLLWALNQKAKYMSILRDIGFWPTRLHGNTR